MHDVNGAASDIEAHIPPRDSPDQQLKDSQTQVIDLIPGFASICWCSCLLDRLSQASILEESDRGRIAELRGHYVKSILQGDNVLYEDMFRNIIIEISDLSKRFATGNNDGSLRDDHTDVGQRIYDFDSIILDETNAAMNEKPHDDSSIEILNYSEKNLTDEELENLCKSKDISKLIEMDISGNRLSDTGVSKVVTRSMDEGARLHVLNVSENDGITYKFIFHLASHVRSLRLSELRSISIAGIHLAGPSLAELLNNLSTSTTPYLHSLNLSDTQLGMRDDAGCEALSFTLSQIRQLSHLDISKNFLRAKHLNQIGEALALMDSIRRLNVSQNAGGYMLVGGSKLPAVAALCFMLGSVASLESINLSNTYMTDETGFILADALSAHPKIKTIDVSDNTSIGLFGITTLLRLILFRPGSVESIDLNHSFAPSTKTLFDFEDPTGRYSLDMKSPVDKAIARQCFHCWEKSGQTFEKTFREIQLDGKPFVKPDKDDENVWQLPEEGRLRFYAIFKLFTDDGAPTTVSGKQAVKQEMLFRFKNGVYSKIKSVENKQEIIRAISDCFEFDCDISELVLDQSNSTVLKLRSLESLLPKVKEPLRVISAALPVFAKLKRPFRFLSSRTGNVDFGLLNPKNPTGHYRLNLNDPLQRSVAFQIFENASRENDSFKEIFFFQVIRNFTVNGVSTAYALTSSIPESGVCEFDYVSPFRLPQSEAIVSVSAHDWNSNIITFFSIYSEKGSQSCLEALKDSATRMFVTSNQLVDLLAKFSEDKQLKLDTTVTFIRRVTDYPNLKEMLCRDRMGIPAVFDHSGVEELEKRLGRIALFNPLKIENTTNDCDFTCEEGRAIAKVILTLLSKEKGSRLVNSRFGETKQTTIAFNPPKSWYTCLPDSGWWSCTYVVDEKSVNQKMRRELAITVCGFDKRSLQ